MKKSNWIKVERYSAAKCPLQNQYCADPMESNWDILGYSAEPILSSGITLELFAPYVARPRKPATEIFRRKLPLWWTVLWTPLWWTVLWTPLWWTVLWTVLWTPLQWTRSTAQPQSVKWPCWTLAFVFKQSELLLTICVCVCVCHFVETWQFWRSRRWSTPCWFYLFPLVGNH